MPQPLRWSARLKHADIEIKRKTITCKSDALNKYGKIGKCCFANFPTNKYGIKRWSILIKQLNRWIILGVCQINHAQKHQFEYIDLFDTGHGHYCISSYGFTYSHSKKTTVGSFHINAGDVIHFEFDSNTGRLTFDNNNGMRITMGVEKKKEEKYAICAYLAAKGNSIELIDY